MERWLPVIGYEGVYEVSDEGRVKRCITGGNTFVGKILRPSTDSQGYLQVRLRGSMHLVHKLVLEAFVETKREGMQTNHRDGDPTNNELGNLEWTTQSENLKHAYRLGLKTRMVGTLNPRAKLTEEQALTILVSDEPGKVLAERYAVSVTTISFLRQRRTWKHLDAARVEAWLRGLNAKAVAA